MRRIEQATLKAVEELNATAKADYGNRFQIKIEEFINSSAYRTNIKVNMVDNLLGIGEIGFTSVSRLGKKFITFRVWECFNRFVCNGLNIKRDDQNSTQSNKGQKE